MKRFLILLFVLFCHMVCADTINLHWLNEDGTVYENSTCVIDSDLILPSTPPTKYGYTFTGWKLGNYIPIEYLESTGTQWIDTGFRFTGNSITYNLKYKKDNYSALVSLFGASYGDNYFTGIPYYVDGNTNRLALACNTATSYITESPGILYTYSLTVNRLSQTWQIIQNNTLYSGTFSCSITNSINIVIFGHNDNGSVVQKSPYKNYGFSIIQDNILVRDFIPVLDTGGVPCMFDKVEGKFYYNQGTGQFIAGPSL